jgi:hypothetical protein
MKRRTILAAAAGLSTLAVLPTRAASSWPPVDVFKSATCGCCKAWVEHLKAAGFDVRVSDVDDTTAARKRLGMPDAFGSCHTGSVGGYVLEGHVPAADVKRLLAAKPQAVGLAVPGMPVGSPGMEVGTRRDPYDVLLVERNGRSTVFASYPH